jgi:NCAIR mutase (PurE)-related protein
MDSDRLHSILTELREGALTVEDAFRRLKDLPYQDLDFARLDHHRELRNRMPEVIFGRGKTPDQVAVLAEAVNEHDGAGLVTFATPESCAAVRERVPQANFDERSGLLWWGDRPRLDGPPVGVVCAGTSDLPVADQAGITAGWLGHEVLRITDVGVAGVHRLIDARRELDRAGVLIVVAGMEGALASAVAGLVSAPIVAVPTSVGYGANFEGLAALLAMLSSCSPGVSVVNIDNGFGAAAVAHRILARKMP